MTYEIFEASAFMKVSASIGWTAALLLLGRILFALSDVLGRWIFWGRR